MSSGALIFGDVRGAGLAAVERHRRREIGQPHRERVDDAAAEAEADRADLAGAFGTRLQPGVRGDEVLGPLLARSSCANSCAAFSSSPG